MAGTSPAKPAVITATAAPRPALSGASRGEAIPSRPWFDPDVAHPARVYRYWLGGKDHYPADRTAAEEVIRQRPEVVDGARANRAFLARAVRYLAGQPSFGGLPVVPPAVVPITEWRPGTRDRFPGPADLHAGLAATTRRPR
jgi:hypothetical protein